MKIVKKIAIGFLILLVLIIGTLVAIPIFFKDDMVQMVKDTVNENVNAKVEFGDFDLTLISTFPDFLFEIQDVSVVGKDVFAKDTLASIGNLSFKVNLKSVMDGNYTINTFEIDKLNAKAIVLKDGKANWDITIPDTAAAAPEADTSAFKFALEEYSITNSNIVYDDRESNMKAIVSDLNHSGTFEMNGDLMNLATQTNIEELSYEMDGINLMNKVKTSAKADMELDLKNSKYTFKQNEFALNDLKLALDGWMAMPTDDIDMDLKIKANNNKFQDVLSLIPAVYKSDIKGLDAKGDFNFSAFVKGKMTENDYPTFGLNLSVNKGYLKYPDLPASLNNVNLILNVDSKTSNLDDMTVDLKSFHMDLAKNPFDMQFFATRLLSDPDMKGHINTNLDLHNITQVFPMEDGQDYRGNLLLDLIFGGKMSSIEKEQYEDFKAEGKLILTGFKYKTAGYPDMKINTLNMNFSPQYVSLSQLDMIVGKSDLNLVGKVENFLAYVFRDETIKGNFQLTSNYFNLDELMGEEPATATTATTAPSAEETSEAIEVPKNIDFVLTSSFKKIDYDNMPIDNLKGTLTVKDGAVNFKETTFNILGGGITMDGSYDTKDPKKPTTNLDFGINGMDIPVAFKTFNTIKTLAPIAQHAKGKFNTRLKFSTALLSDMTPDYKTLNGGGSLSTQQVLIENQPLMSKIAEALKNPKYKKMRAEDLKVNYEIKDGKLNVKPFDIKMGTSSAKVYGWTSFDQTMEYTFEFKIPRKEFGAEANALLNSLESQAKQAGLNASVGEYVFVNVIASGTVTNPKIKVVPKGTDGGKSLQDQAKDAAKAEIEKQRKEAEARAKAELEKQQKEAEAKAKAEIEKQKKEAEAKVKQETKKQEEKLKNQGKDLLKGLGR